MTKIPLDSQKCPDREELSAYFDGESQNTSVTGAHIAHCAKCRRYLADLAVMHDAVQAQINDPEADSPELSSRVLACVRNELVKEQFKRRKWSIKSFHFLRVAAVLVLTVTLWYYFQKEYFPSSETGKNAPEFPAGVEPSAAVPAVLAASDVKNPEPVNLSEITPVSFTLERQGTAAGQAPAVIPETVRQNWIMPEGVSRSIPENIAGDIGITGYSVQPHASDGELRVTFKCTKLQAVLFVRACHAAGFKLISAVQPQPEQNYFDGAAADKISYTGIFTEK